MKVIKKHDKQTGLQCYRQLMSQVQRRTLCLTAPPALVLPSRSPVPHADTRADDLRMPGQVEAMSFCRHSALNTLLAQVEQALSCRLPRRLLSLAV